MYMLHCELTDFVPISDYLVEYALTIMSYHEGYLNKMIVNPLPSPTRRYYQYFTKERPFKVYRESYKLYKGSPLKFNPFPESRRGLNVPTVTVTLPTRDIIVDPMTLAGLEPPPALQTNISPLDTQSDMNI